MGTRTGESPQTRANVPHHAPTTATDDFGWNPTSAKTRNEAAPAGGIDHGRGMSSETAPTEKGPKDSDGTGYATPMISGSERAGLGATTDPVMRRTTKTVPPDVPHQNGGRGTAVGESETALVTPAGR